MAFIEPLIIIGLVVLFLLLIRGWNVSHNRHTEGMEKADFDVRVCPEGFDTSQLTPECLTQCACASSGCTYQECALTTELPDGCCCPKHPDDGSCCGADTPCGSSDTTDSIVFPEESFTSNSALEDEITLYRNTGRRGRSPMYGWRVNPSPEDAKYPIVPTLFSEGEDCVKSCYNQIRQVGWGYLEEDGTNSLTSCILECGNSAANIAFEEIKDR
jgi:hypothetical protein